MIMTVVTCDKCANQLFLRGTKGIVFTTSVARENGYRMGKIHLCHDCRKKKKSMPVAYKEGKHE